MTETDTAAETAATVQTRQKQLLFDGSRKPLFWLLLRNLGLTIITVGIYRFWAKTRVRQFFWRHTRLLDEPLEYLGTGAELFVGFLIAIVILVPLGAIYSLLGFFSVGQPFTVSLAIDIVYYTVLAFLVQVAIHRMRRYRLTRTAWRGVRFGLDGSSVKYALISFGYGILSMVTLGLAHPWLRVATMKYFFGNARFGTATLSLDASGRWLFKRWLIVAAPLAVGLGFFYVINGPIFIEMMDINARSEAGEEVGEEALALVNAIQYWPFALFFVSMVLGIWYGVVEFRYLTGGVRMGNVALRSEMPAPFVYRVYILFWIAFLILGGIIAGLAGWGISESAEPGGQRSFGIWQILSIGLFIVLFLFYGILRTLFVDVTLLKRACETLSVDNPQELDNVIQSSADLPRHGEGLADALDLGGF
ncbi:MAG: YjgN family protein [Alphaproteobacteria bacterium]